MFTSSQVADRIKATAHARGILVKDLLISCKLSKNTLSTMKSGGCFPRIEALATMADELNCSVDYLLGRTDDPGTTINSPEDAEVLRQYHALSPDARKAADCLLKGVSEQP